MNVRKFKGEEMKIEEEIVVAKKRIRTRGSLQKSDGKDNDKGMERRRRRR